MESKTPYSLIMTAMGIGAGILVGLCFMSPPIGLSTSILLSFLGFMLGAILDLLFAINTQINQLRKNR